MEASRLRREEALKDMTVGNIYQKYAFDYPWVKQQGLKDLADMISAHFIPVEELLDPTLEQVEDALYRMEIIDLTAGTEVFHYIVLAFVGYPLQKLDGKHRLIKLCIRNHQGGPCHSASSSVQAAVAKRLLLWSI